MRCSLLPTNKGGGREEEKRIIGGGGPPLVAGLFARLVAATMGCLFGCFRIKDSTAHLPSHSDPATPTPTDASNKKRNPLSSFLLFAEEERVESPNFGEKENKELESTPQAEFDVKELKDEAKFLKACGILQETPIEIRQISKELKGQSSDQGEPERLKFRSWLTGSSIEKLHYEKESYEPPTPEGKYEDLVKETLSSEQTPSSCMTGLHNTGRFSAISADGNGIQNVSTSNEVHAHQSCSSAASSVHSRNSAPSVQGRNKSVRFDCEPIISSISRSSSSEISSENSKKSEVAGNRNALRPEPFPTPLKLSDEMQTPGTVFPAYIDDVANGKKTRIRSQYVYSVLNPVEDLAQWKILKDEHSNYNQSSNQLGEFLEQVNEGNSISEEETTETSERKESKVEASLSSWLKPVTNREGNNPLLPRANALSARTPGDRPIIGMVAAHWNDDEPSRISPKWWDGNGIPNSTNKYKEDQKVSWHATPFEERLEKALSEETFISQRKHISGTPPIDFGESEESDTALSKFPSSSSCKSIVSC